MNPRPRQNHRKLKLSVGDIYLDSRRAKIEPGKQLPRGQASDPFVSYKESCTIGMIRSFAGFQVEWEAVDDRLEASFEVVGESSESVQVGVENEIADHRDGRPLIQLHKGNYLLT